MSDSAGSLSKLQSMLNANVAKATGGNESFGAPKLAGGKRHHKTGKKHRRHHKKHGGSTAKLAGGRRRKSHRKH